MKMYLQRYDHSEEKALLISLRSGCQLAFKNIYNAYSGRIYLNIRKMIKSEEDSTELLQEVFIKVWNKRELINPEQSFRSYLFMIAKNTVYNYLRKNTIEKHVHDYVSLHTVQIYSHVEEQLVEKQEEQWLSHIIEQLPPQRKIIYKMCKLEGKTYAEVGNMLSISTSTINDHIVKATKFIKEKYMILDKPILLLVSYILLQNQ